MGGCIKGECLSWASDSSVGALYFFRECLNSVSNFSTTPNLCQDPQKIRGPGSAESKIRVLVDPEPQDFDLPEDLVDPGPQDFALPRDLVDPGPQDFVLPGMLGC